MAPSRIRDLEEKIQSPVAEVWESALQELSGIRHEKALTLLHSACSHVDEPRARFAGECFESSICRDPELALRHSDYEIREVALQIVGRLREKQAVGEVSRILRNESSDSLRELAARTLAEIGDESCAAGLQHAQQDESVRIRKVALEALIKLRYAAAERAIVEFLDDEDWSLRERAFELLSNNGWVPKTNRERVLRGIMKGRFDEVLQFASDALQPLVNAALCPGNPEVRHWSAVTLARIRSPRVVEELRQGLKSPDPKVQEAAEAALRTVGTAPEPKPSPVPKTPAVRCAVPAPKAPRPFDEACEMLATALEL